MSGSGTSCAVGSIQTKTAAEFLHRYPLLLPANYLHVLLQQFGDFRVDSHGYSAGFPFLKEVGSILTDTVAHGRTGAGERPARRWLHSSRIRCSFSRTCRFRGDWGCPGGGGAARRRRRCASGNHKFRCLVLVELVLALCHHAYGFPYYIYTYAHKSYKLWYGDIASARASCFEDKKRRCTRDVMGNERTIQYW